MAKVFITGSSQGLGLMAGQLLIAEGHEVVLHGRDQARADTALTAAPGARGAVAGDLSSLAAMRHVAEQANDLGPFDAVIHNVGVGYQEPRRIETEDGLPHVFAVNVVAPHVLTALTQRPKRLVYLSSGLHRGAAPDFDDLLWRKRRWQGTQAYSESKFLDVVLAFGIARGWPGVLSNALQPGWVATRMGGRHATDDLGRGHLTRRGWPPATTRRLSRPVATSTTWHLARRTRSPATRPPRTLFWRTARTCPVSSFPRDLSTSKALARLSVFGMTKRGATCGLRKIASDRVRSQHGRARLGLSKRR